MNFPEARSENLVIQELADELLICDTETYRAFCLNKTAAEVWKLCDGKTDVKRIAQLLSEELGTGVSEELVWLSLNQLSGENLLQKTFTPAENFGGLTRREVVRRIGLSSLVVLPAISTLVMPTAAQAQSGGAGGPGAPCSSPAQCQSGLICCAPSNPECNPGC